MQVNRPVRFDFHGEKLSAMVFFFSWVNSDKMATAAAPMLFSLAVNCSQQQLPATVKTGSGP